MINSVDGLLSLLNAGEDWEATIFEAACAGAREHAQRLLEALDEVLAAKREGDLVIEGFRSRTVLTRFGPVRVRRRLYRVQGRKRYRFLLDEALGWSKRKAMSPTLSAIAAELASRVSYREAARVLGQLISQSVGAMSLHRQVQAVGSAIDKAETGAREAVYGQGREPPAGSKVANPLFIEADGLSIALQRETQRRAEVKRVIAYAGTEMVGVDKHGRTRRRLVDKVSYAGIESGREFWESAYLAIGAQCDLANSSVVVGGDGASWIRGGLDGLKDGLFQLDRFHLARELQRVLGPTGMVAFQAARTRRDGELKALLAQAWRDASQDPHRIRELETLEHYLSSNRDGLVDWTLRAGVASDVHLGAIESNMDEPLANRFKKRGMSWTIRGAHHMAKLLQLREGGQLPHACRRPAAQPTPRPTGSRRTRGSQTTPSAPPFQATLVARWGPHANRPWVQALRRLIEADTILVSSSPRRPTNP